MIALALAVALTFEAPASPDVVVVGDSISARNSTENPAWWNYLDATVHLSAQSGSGMGREGARCAGTTFADRLSDIQAAQPDQIIVAGGRNDWAHCKNGQRVKSSKKRIRETVRRYTIDLALAARHVGVSRSDVFMASPWGTARGSERRVVRKWVRFYAVKRGFTWVRLPAFRDGLTVDRTHPNAEGNRRLGSLIGEAL